MFNRIVCCKVYVSEGRNQALLEKLSEISQNTQPLRCALVQRFSDSIYHRSNFTLGGAPESVAEVALNVIDQALKEVDLATHVASHPRIGAVDHVSLHPLGTTSLDTAKDVAIQIGNDLNITTMTYRRSNGKRLADVRRSTSYFKSLDLEKEISSPDFGPTTVDPRLGVLCCGAVPYVQNYNIRLRTKDRALAAKVTKRIREKDGGLKGVEALTLVHANGHMEVACNLLDIHTQTPACKVLAQVEATARELGVEVEEAYTIGMTEEEIYHDVCRKLGWSLQQSL